MLKLSPAISELTVIVPVETEQVGCSVTLAVGDTGAVGCEFIVTVDVGVEVQPSELVTVKV